MIYQTLGNTPHTIKRDKAIRAEFNNVIKQYLRARGYAPRGMMLFRRYECDGTMSFTFQIFQISGDTKDSVKLYRKFALKGKFTYISEGKYQLQDIVDGY